MFPTFVDHLAISCEKLTKFANTLIDLAFVGIRKAYGDVMSYFGLYSKAVMKHSLASEINDT